MSAHATFTLIKERSVSSWAVFIFPKKPRTMNAPGYREIIMHDVMSTFDFADPHWRPFLQEKLDALGITPNQLWANTTNGKIGALVVKKSSKYAEFALSEAGLRYLCAAEQAGKIGAGFVVLVAWNGRKLAPVQIKPVADVAAALDGIPPREGPFGAYWWINPDGTPNAPLPFDDGDAPY
jgi:hypothetical protein